ncbi:polysaccharide deacetylase family protein [Variovorax sp. GB1P17]|uniref:polysaccharide deacetylase family protein n=1 Tax=Variovorax sp. GB1P17 TaxID=3443740 RepID=UPI003F462473
MSNARRRLLVGATVFFSLLSSVNALTWPNGAISLSHDDGWPSQLTQATTLESYGFRGTFYLTPGGLPVVVSNASSWQSVFQRGHEVGNHSYSHWGSATLAGKTWVDVATDVGTNEQWLLTNIYSNTSVDHTYAYPEGN